MKAAKLRLISRGLRALAFFAESDPPAAASLIATCSQEWSAFVEEWKKEDAEETSWLSDVAARVAKLEQAAAKVVRS